MKKFYWYLVGGGVFFVLGAATFFLWKSGFLPRRKADGAVTEALVQVLAETRSGSGVIYRYDAHTLTVITAGHVLEEAKEPVWVSFCDGWAVECSDYQRMEDADLAFIKVPMDEIPEERLEEYCSAPQDKESFDRLQIGDEVKVMGFSSEAGDKVYEGVLEETWIWVEDFSQYMMLVKAPAEAGMSGGGVFDQEGRLAGILCGGNEEGLLAVLPLSIIEAEYAGIS